MVEESARFWYSKSNVLLSSEEVREVHENLAGFFQVLHEWDMRSKEQQSEANPVGL